MTFQLPRARLEELRDRLRDRGTSRRSMVVPSAEPAVLEDLISQILHLSADLADLTLILYSTRSSEAAILSLEGVAEEGGGQAANFGGKSGRVRRRFAGARTSKAEKCGDFGDKT